MRYIVGRFWDWLDSKFGIPKSETPRSLPWNFGYTDEEHEYDWDDWGKEMKKKYPIRYFIFHEFDIWVSVKYRIYVEDPIYWFKSMFIKKQHLLDLRKGEWSKGDMRYKFGYVDPHYVVEMAAYASFLNYLDELDANFGPKGWGGEEGVSGLEKCIKDKQEWLGNSECDGEKSAAQGWLDHYLKMKEIKIFFEEELPAMEEQSNKMYPPKNITRAEARKYYDDKEAFDKNMKDKTTEMLCEIIKQRESMWT